MADNITLNSGSGGATLAADDITSVWYQRVKLTDGTADSTTPIAAGGGVEAGALRVTLASDSTGVVSVDDNGGSLTVDNAALSVVGGGVEATAIRVTLASDSTGLVSVDDNGGSLTVDNGGTFAVQATIAAGATNIAKAEDAASADADVGVPAMAVRKATPANTSGLDGDYEMLQMSAGRLWTSTTVDAALPAGTNAIGKLAANSGVDIGDVDILSIAAGDNNIGNVDIVTMPNVTLAAGTNTNEVVGDAAHDAAVAGNPVRIAGRAVTADYTSVATGDTADLITTVGGKLITHPYAIPENYVSGATSDMTATTSTSVVAAAGAGLRNYITQIVVQNSHATVGTWVNIQDGSGGTTLYTIYAAALGGGAAITLPCPIKTTANTALYCANVTTGANTRVSASGYKAP